MLLDLHVHIWPHSTCSNMKLEETVLHAKSMGLDGICLTDHNYIWDRELVQRYRRDLSFRIFRGIELAAPLGHLLVFGAKKIPTVLSFNDLEILASQVEYFCILAHPFRFLSNYQLEKLQTRASSSENLKVLKTVNAIEVYNGSNSEKDNSLGERLVEAMGLKATAGSDAHALMEIGMCITELENDVDTEEQLIKELRAGRFHPVKKYTQPDDNH